HRSAMKQTLASVLASGETDLPPTLLEVQRVLAGVAAAKKHIIVISDGRSLPPTGADYPTMIQRLTASGVSLSTIALGSGADQTLLAELARLGGGRSSLVLNT